MKKILYLDDYVMSSIALQIHRGKCQVAISFYILQECLWGFFLFSFFIIFYLFFFEKIDEATPATLNIRRASYTITWILLPMTTQFPTCSSKPSDPACSSNISGGNGSSRA